ncbi:S4 domain-containing protein YaaA [Paenibacillus mendelii]|uniref:S4 domain-containing protein YaaA n=1 Tax=Paenibacillus mendelii TaxID=206163 RepID=A0ABV6JDS4_9BACL|nr:S4 domain-containing protein YaaA [Paenibacillus mendelii]MCQ6563409.1 S4 domain-containing protein YaaA [Paenibacillus mendelii]
MNEVNIKTEYIALGQFLKLAGCIDTGGAAKFFLQETKILINGEPDNRRGRKLYHGDRVEIEGFDVFTVVKQ